MQHNIICPEEINLPGQFLIDRDFFGYSSMFVLCTGDDSHNTVIESLSLDDDSSWSLVWFSTLSSGFIS